MSGGRKLGWLMVNKRSDDRDEVEDNRWKLCPGSTHCSRMDDSRCDRLSGRRRAQMRSLFDQLVSLMVSFASILARSQPTKK